MNAKTKKPLTTVIIRFAGDSGDGMQVIGQQFAVASSSLGNDIHTFADFPAEIRAPAGTLPGVSGFQLHFSQHEIHTFGDKVDVLVAMNPAALKTNLKDLKKNGLLLINHDAFEEKEIKKAAWEKNPLETKELDVYQFYTLPMTQLTLKAVEKSEISFSQAKKCKNMFALGVVCWLYSRSLESISTWLEKKFGKSPAILSANKLALQAGYAYADTSEMFSERYEIKKASLAPGTYRQLNGNEALALGCVAASVLSKRPLLLASYPITPASSLLQQLSHYASFGIKTFQAEDEIAAVCAAIGAAYGGALAMTSTSGPGMDLKSEGVGLAVMTELPLVIVDVQRAGPSTGMPTKTEQSDLLMSMYGRHGECPVVILAPQSPSDNFEIVLEAFRLAINYMTPVIILSDGLLATSAEPWLIPELEKCPSLEVFPKKQGAFQRDETTLARMWVTPGTPQQEYRMGGLEKDKDTGNISYDPENHQAMVRLRSEKIKRIENEIPDAEIMGPEKNKLLVVSWGSTYGAVLSAVETAQQNQHPVSMLHLRYLNPFPKNLKLLLKNFEKVMVPELNLGQLSKLLRAEFLIEVISLNKVTGKPFLIEEIYQRICELV